MSDCGETFLNQRKLEYYHGNLLDADYKETFKVMNSLLSYSVRTPLLPATSDKNPTG